MAEPRSFKQYYITLKCRAIEFTTALETWLGFLVAIISGTVLIHETWLLAFLVSIHSIQLYTVGFF